ncbi:hypothetical protein NK8_28870 [Caballeronia sp. NK8]|nr:hypothetical protein NK8_28870 [Caballeronia sp. NK8]
MRDVAYKQRDVAERLYALSGYESHRRNFKASRIRALEKLNGRETPLCSRVATYHFNQDRKIYVIRSELRAAVVN